MILPAIIAVARRERKVIENGADPRVVEAPADATIPRMARDYYETLGVSRTATDADIKKAYRRLAMKYHPDRNPGHEKQATEQFKEINEAYSVLGDAEKRQQYDQYGTVGNIGDIFGSNTTRAGFEGVVRDFGGLGLDLGFLESIFGDALRGRGYRVSFGDMGRSGRVRFRRRSGQTADAEEAAGDASGQPTSKTVRYELALTAEEAEKGTRKRLTRNGRRLEVTVPAGVKDGSVVKLANACRLTDACEGDIVIRIKVK